MAYTLSFTGTGTGGTDIQDVDGTDSPNQGRAKLNDNLKVLVDAHNDHNSALSGISGGIADLTGEQAFLNKTIQSNGGGGGTNNIHIGRSDIKDTYLSFTSKYDGVTIGNVKTLAVVQSAYDVTISGYGGFQPQCDNINKVITMGFPQVAYMNHTDGAQSFVINNDTVTAGNTFDVDGNAVVRSKLAIGDDHTSAAEYDTHIKKTTGTAELAIESIDSHAILHLQSDTDEGKDGIINFSADATVKGSINFSHNTTSYEQKMSFVMGDNAQTPLTLTGGTRVGINEASPSTRLHIDGSGLNNEIGGIRQTASGGSVSMWHGTTYGVIETQQDTGIILRTNTTTNNNQIVLESTTGNVGINMATPKHALHVTGNVMLGPADAYLHADGHLAVQSDGHVILTADVNQTGTPGNDIILGAGSSASAQSAGTSDFAATYPGNVPNNEYMRIKGNTGKVGIGTISPSTKLHVKGTSGTHLTIDGTSADYLFKTNSTSGYATSFDMDDAALSIGHNSQNRRLDLQTNNTTRLSIHGNTGNVGIGTTSPSAYLHINQDDNLGSAVGSQQIFMKNSGDTVNNDVLETSLIRTSTYSDANDWQSAQWRIQRKVDSTYMGWIGFCGEEGAGANNFGISFGIGGSGDTDNALQADEAMRIDGANGNVGIGTASPGEKLTVSGSANISTNLTVGGTMTVAGSTTYTNTLTVDGSTAGKNFVMTNNMNADLGNDHSQRQGIEFKQTGSQTNDKNGFVGLEYKNASNFPVFRLGGYGNGMWDYCTYIASNAGLGLPYGTNSQRPVTNVNKAQVQQSSNLGIIRYNTTTKLVEVYTSNSGSAK